MSLIRINNKLPSKILNRRYFANALPNDDEYSSRPEYPPILNLSFKENLKRKKQKVHEEIKAVKTVEEKQIKLNMPRYYGFKSYLLNNESNPYNSLNLVQHVTRTHLIVNNGLPDFYRSVEVDNFVKEVQFDIEEAILIEVEAYQLRDKSISTKKNKLDNLACLLSKAINRVLINQLSTSCTHLLEIQVDFNPRIETSWYAGGMNPPDHIKRCRKGFFLKEYENDPVDRLMVYTGSPIISLRSKLPLPLIASPSDLGPATLEVPFWKYDPRTVGTKTEHRPMINTPGFWPGDPYQFGQLSLYKRAVRRTFDETNIKEDEPLLRQGILSSFGWLHAQANFLGFTTFNDITYPLTTQTVVTDGKMWRFFSFQMNTMLLHNNNILENPNKNVCWASQEMKLFEGVEGGKVVGFNEDVLKCLLKFYVNTPEERLGVNMRPYLNNKEKLVADYEDDDKRQWLEREYKYLTSNRPRFKLPYEIYSWEKIYKIDNKTRFIEKRLRPFELFQTPYKRTLDNRLANYIPRKLRPDLPRHKGRYAEEYFP